MDEWRKAIEGMLATLRAMERRRPSAKKLNANAQIRSIAAEIGELAPGVEYWITHNGLYGEYMQTNEYANIKDQRVRGELRKMALAMNGYVAFPKRGFSLHDVLVDFIPVHGGITYRTKDQTATVYGFDTLHFNSDNLPIHEPAWIKWQCHVLYEGVLLAKKLGPAYRRATTIEKKAAILQELKNLVPESEINTGAIIRMMCGDL